MKIIAKIATMQTLSRRFRLKGKTIGFVPTMGYLHEGHLSLIRRSKRETDITVLSIFVNPKQFGPKEDFRRYPRDKNRDYRLAKKENVDIILHPSEKEMYPSGFFTEVKTLRLSEGLCGAFRPGHFRGVTTVVSKLLNIVGPDVLYLGQKDFQQAVILKKMVADLNFSAQVRICPTIRDKDGLAMSSRNKYLTRPQRQEAAMIYLALKKAKALIHQGEKRAAVSKRLIWDMLLKTRTRKIDYIECVDAETLRPLKIIKGKLAIALAVWFGRTRLIDNIIVDIS